MRKYFLSFCSIFSQFTTLRLALLPSTDVPPTSLDQPLYVVAPALIGASSANLDHVVEGHVQHALEDRAALAAGGCFKRAPHCSKRGVVLGSCTSREITRSRGARLLAGSDDRHISLRARPAAEKGSLAHRSPAKSQPASALLRQSGRKGLSNKAIARSLDISPSTVDRYREVARRAINVGSHTELL